MGQFGRHLVAPGFGNEEVGHDKNFSLPGFNTGDKQGWIESLRTTL
jgi:hypothetical protein